MSKRKLVAECERTTALRLAVKTSPARSWRELDAVGEALLGRGEHCAATFTTSSVLSVQEALHIVDIWRIRQSNLPHAIESTASIAEILSKEHHHRHQYSEHELRLLLAAVLTRSVNGLADVLQQNRATAASVAGLCAKLGIPAWIVQLRHDATHQQLPPLPSLRMGATSLLAFFDSIYWTPQRQQHEHAYDCIMDKLKNYEKEVDKNSQKVESSSQRSKNVLSNNESQQQDDNGSDDTSEDDDPFGLTGSRLGSSKNQFALLRHKKKKADEKAKPKKKKNETATKLSQMASDIVDSSSTDLPCDILFQAMLDFLVGTGILATSPLPYRFLLKAMGHVWPRFLPVVFVQCCNKASTEAMALSAVKFLCSRNFVKMFDKATQGGEGHASASTLLLKLSYPLNSLCDQAPPGTPLHQLLLEILGSERAPFYGIALDVTASNESSSSGTSEGSRKVASPWKRCVKWEPCPLGSLPTDL